MKRRNFIANLFAAPAALAVVGDPVSKSERLEAELRALLKGAPPKPKITQQIVINTNDPDVDRLMAGFIEYAERLSDERVQPYDPGIMGR